MRCFAPAASSPLRAGVILMTILIYLSHPQVQMDPAVPVPRWSLSAIGRFRLLTLHDAPWVRSLTALHSSDEAKAIETAAVLAGFAGCPVTEHADMGENDRAATGFLPPPEFEATADAFFATPDVSVRGWERAIDAQTRIVTAIERVLAGHDPDTPIGLCGHGAVGTLAFCHYAGEPIRRSRDQPAGGGNAYVLDLSTRRPRFGWVAMEQLSHLLPAR
jgi:broad specificity phosphatase PhoE